MNKEAIFTDETERFCFPPNPKVGEKISIILRTLKGDSLSPYLCHDTKEYLMSLHYTADRFDFYIYTTVLKTHGFSYFFKIEYGQEVIYYDKRGINNEPLSEYFFKVSNFNVPDWAKGAVMYQIYVDRFSKGSEDNTVCDNEYYYIDTLVKRIDDWRKPPENFDVASFYGGDLTGVINKLGYLKNLSIEAIYFNPLFVSPSNHKYDTQDYENIDPHIGKIVVDEGICLKDFEQDNTGASKYISRTTNRDNLEESNRLFIKLVETAHNLGIKVIIDGVFNHCGSFNYWLDKEGIYRNNKVSGAYWDKSSPYREYFEFDGEGYKGWWNHDTLPKLNYENSPKLCKYIMNIAKKWVSPPYNADGWRLDVAADLGHSEEFNHKFWKDFRQAVKEANPNALILAEHYGNPIPWLQGDEWDSIMNYDAFMDPVSYFLTGMEKHSDFYEERLLANGEAFQFAMTHAMGKLHNFSLQSAMNQLSNHDHSRFLTRTNHIIGRANMLGSEIAGANIDKTIFRLGVIMQMTWPGCPTLYYGDEAGQVGFTDPDSRRTYPWGEEDMELIDFHRDIIYIHRQSEALRLGSFTFLDSDYGYVSYARFTAKEAVIVVINMRDIPVSYDIPVWRAEIPRLSTLKRLMIVNESGYSILPKEYNTENYIKIDMQAKSGIICKWE